MVDRCRARFALQLAHTYRRETQHTHTCVERLAHGREGLDQILLARQHVLPLLTPAHAVGLKRLLLQLVRVHDDFKGVLQVCVGRDIEAFHLAGERGVVLGAHLAGERRVVLGA